VDLELEMEMNSDYGEQTDGEISGSGITLDPSLIVFV